TLGATVFGALLALFGFAQARRFRRIAGLSAASARAAKAANEAKSRFLTMMSHELRTPMNGVLGLIALGRRDAASPAQDALLEQAESSGRRMMEMIGDIIDYTAVDGRPPSTAPKPFSLAELAAELEAKVAAATGAGDARPRWVVERSSRAPAQCVGGGDYLRRALEHLCGYLLDTAGVSDARVLIDFADGELRVEISFNYLAEDEAGWRPERILAAEAVKKGDDAFAADPLGPKLARGFVAAIGGRIELTSLYRGRTAVVVMAPVEPLTRRAPMVGLAVASATMRMICASVLRGAGAEIVEAGDPGREATAVLVECDDDADGAHYVEALRRAHPHARVVCLGAPRRRDLYDAVAPLPVEVNALTAALFGEGPDPDGPSAETPGAVAAVG
ncbi:MAG: histidine kinase dimerization/phospho-acceptor domain-containing protein, partial [Pseudomonadota bacterium]